MKIRIQGNSLRLRLTQSEVAQFQAEGKVTDQVRFPNQKDLTYQLVRSSGTEAASAGLTDNVITLSVPIALASSWADTNQVGFETQIKLDGAESLHLLVEKDFKCLTRRSDDNSDLYPNPLTQNESQ